MSISSRTVLTQAAQEKNATQIPDRAKMAVSDFN
jgi:hypothetical protein